MSDTLPLTDRSRLRRLHERGSHEREAIDAILDAQPLCSVGYIMDGRPYVTPTLQWREGDHVYWHGSAASRALRAGKGAEVCLSVSILDGYVLARSGFHHTVNSRSVTLFGTAFVVEAEEKRARLEAFVEHLFPGRLATLRRDRDQDIKGTMILGLKIEEGSAKVRSGMPKDEPEDYDLPIWAGVLPVRTVYGTPEPDPRNPEGLPLPAHLARFATPG